MPKTPRVYVAFCFYICNLSGMPVIVGKFLVIAGILYNFCGE
ncbi:hypothetical protein BMR22_14710 [Escherichia marmotae]|nr:hypothetical protein BMR22_14710 [Escherichia marmotae]PGF83398.1 hypothetical protein BMR23_12615 [Escherichia marmotae]